MKSEPDEYSIDDLERDGVEMWDGVRNYQARNFMRDEMKVGDTVFFYHSNTKRVGIYGLAEVASRPYPDPTAFDKNDKHFDPRSKREDPTWYLVDVRFKQKFEHPITLEQMKQDKKLEGFRLLAKGNRLSVFPTEERYAKHILSLV